MRYRPHINRFQNRAGIVFFGVDSETFRVNMVLFDKRHYEFFEIGLLRRARYSNIAFIKEWQQLFAFYFFFKMIKRIIQQHPCRVVANDLGIFKHEFNAHSLVFDVVGKYL